MLGADVQSLPDLLTSLYPLSLPAPGEGGMPDAAFSQLPGRDGAEEVGRTQGPRAGFPETDLGQKKNQGQYHWVDYF